MLLLWAFSGAQQASLRGMLQDTTEFRTVAYATVIVINAADSTIAAHTYAGNNGSFELGGLPAGRFRVLIVRPGFADYEDFIDLKPGEQKELGIINLLSRLNLLKEVIIRDRLEAIRIKGDTTEFLVDSFLTNKNASVEDLMKRLPGIQVDKDGKITAQGKEVQKVLVDGEEFFGDDPTIATRNIRATQVESIQVYDKKSEQATVTGVDDGVKEKTINLKLKEEAKKGYFGKVAAGVGTRDRYEHDAMFNRFNRKQKISAYGAMSNTNKTSLSWEDNQKFGGNEGMNMESDDDGNMYMYYSSGEEDNHFDGVGIPRTWYLGAHYSDKLASDRHSFSVNASHKEMNVEGFDSNYTKYILPDTFYFNNSRNEINNFRSGANVSGVYTLAFDSLTTIKLRVNASRGEFRRRSTYRTENRNEENALVNSNNRTTTENGNTQALKTNLTLVRKFRKTGRSLSLGVVQEYRQRESEGLLLSGTNFYQPDSSFISIAIDQKKVNRSFMNHYTLNGSYTEPLSARFSLVSDYALTVNDDKSTRLTLEKSATPEYDRQVDSLSNDFAYNVYINKGGIALSYKYKKINTNLGGRVSYTDLVLNNLVSGQGRNQSFINYFPSARFNYKIGTASAFDVSYNGSTRQPSLAQVQPIIDNTNPLELTIGNTALVQSFTNSYRLMYNMYKPLTGTSLWSSMSFNHTYDGFATRSFVDTSGRRINQAVNTDGNRNFYANIYHYIQLKKLKLGLGQHAYTNISRQVNFVNDRENVNRNQQLTYGTSLSKDVDDKYYIRMAADWNYNRSTTSVRPDVITSFWTQTYNMEFTYYFPRKIQFETEVTYNVRQKTSDFDNNLNTLIASAGISKKFGKNENLDVELIVRDLFNQDLGFRRTAYTNFINENVHTVLRRYFMIRITYNISSAFHNGKEEEK